MRQICGVDEAGRGALAGPVVAAAVVLSDDFPTHLLKDSKKLSPKKRSGLEFLIKEHALFWSVAEISPQIIDEINILQATMMAMQQAVGKIQEHHLIIKALIDGNRCPELSCEAEAVIKGDDLIPEIMAASILAKVARDRIMVAYDIEWPHYHFAQNKGYPTKTHKEALRTFGPSSIHRLSFTY